MSETAERARAARSTEVVLNALSIPGPRYHGEDADQPRLVGSPS